MILNSRAIFIGVHFIYCCGYVKGRVNVLFLHMYCNTEFDRGCKRVNGGFMMSY